MKFSEQHKVGLAHFDEDMKRTERWTCQCADCAALRQWQNARAKRREAKREPVNVLIAVMVARARGDATELARQQFRFEQIMVRRLKLHHLDSAHIYGFKTKLKEAA